jgi:hypothetical protein
MNNLKKETQAFRPVFATLFWSILWGVGGWLYAKAESYPRSFFLGIPLILPCVVTIWATVHFFWENRENRPIFGALGGLLFGASIGFFGFFILMRLGTITEIIPIPQSLRCWTTLWGFASGGIVAGFVSALLLHFSEYLLTQRREFPSEED